MDFLPTDSELAGYFDKDLHPTSELFWDPEVLGVVSAMRQKGSTDENLR